MMHQQKPPIYMSPLSPMTISDIDKLMNSLQPILKSSHHCLERLAVNCQNQYEVQRELKRQTSIIHFHQDCKPLQKTASSAIRVYKRLRTWILSTLLFESTHQLLKLTSFDTSTRWKWISSRALNITRWMSCICLCITLGWYMVKCSHLPFHWWRIIHYHYVTAPPLTVYSIKDTYPKTTTQSTIYHFLIHQRLLNQFQHKGGTLLDLFPTIQS
jgi:hypothetical protein